MALGNDDSAFPFDKFASMCGLYLVKRPGSTIEGYNGIMEIRGRPPLTSKYLHCFETPLPQNFPEVCTVDGIVFGPKITFCAAQELTQSERSLPV